MMRNNIDEQDVLKLMHNEDLSYLESVEKLEKLRVEKEHQEYLREVAEAEALWNLAPYSEYVNF